MDDEGRCLLVDFGSFVVFNVYAPHVGKVEDQPRKRRFLGALQRSMNRCRAKKQNVILMGDLNITYRRADSALINRWLRVLPNGQVEGASWQVDDAEYRDRGMVPIGYLIENNLAPLGALKNRGETAHWGREPESVRWLRRLVPLDAKAVEESDSEAEDPSEERFEYRDTFAALFPSATERFTVWNQTKNLRYKNVGSRIDFAIVDRELYELVDKKPEPLFGGPGFHGALSACTLDGQWHEAPKAGPLAGSGLSLQRDDMKLNDQQFLTPSTGIVYTPPSYSDHVPVTLKLSKLPGSRNDEEKRAEWPLKDTRACQPWKNFGSVSAFFQVKPKEAKKRKVDES